MSVLGAAAIGAGASALGSLFNFGSQARTNKANRQLAAQQNEYAQALQDREFQYNTAASETEYQRNLELWNMQNEYNSPAGQIQRYQEAGLNPNLIYGSGSSAGTASAPQSYTAARYSAPSANRSTDQAPQVQFDPYQAVSIGQALAIQKSQKEQIDAQTQSIVQNTKNSEIEELIKAANLLGVNLSNREREALFETRIDQARENLRKTTAETANLHHLAINLQHDRALKEIGYDKLIQEVRNLKQTYDVNDFKYRLLKLGVTDRDNFITRFASRLLLANEEEIQSLFNSLFK